MSTLQCKKSNGRRHFNCAGSRCPCCHRFHTFTCNLTACGSRATHDLPVCFHFDAGVDLNIPAALGAASPWSRRGAHAMRTSLPNLMTWVPQHLWPRWSVVESWPAHGLPVRTRRKRSWLASLVEAMDFASADIAGGDIEASETKPDTSVTLGAGDTSSSPATTCDAKLKWHFKTSQRPSNSSTLPAPGRFSGARIFRTQKERGQTGRDHVQNVGERRARGTEGHPGRGLRQGLQYPLRRRTARRGIGHE